VKVMAASAANEKMAARYGVLWPEPLARPSVVDSPVLQTNMAPLPICLPELDLIRNKLEHRPVVRHKVGVRIHLVPYCM
jgi:hypothetical protein